MKIKIQALLIGLLLVSSINCEAKKDEKLSTVDFEILKKHDIDPHFGKAVAVVESGWKHDSSLAINKNNIFGLMGKGGAMSFKSKNDCIEYFGELMNRPLYKDKTVDEIARIYCPATSKSWASKVKAIMSDLKEAEDEKKKEKAKTKEKLANARIGYASWIYIAEQSY